MNLYGLILDILIIGVLVYGYYKGYRRGIITMTISVVSFIVGLIGLKTVGSLLYVIFGDSIETIINNFLMAKTSNNELTAILIRQILGEALIKKIIQLICFVITYVVVSTVVSYILKKMRFNINNQFLNTLDKNFGGAVGTLSALISVMLVLGVFSVLITQNEESVLNTMVSTGYVGRFIYAINPIRLLLG